MPKIFVSAANGGSSTSELQYLASDDDDDDDEATFYDSLFQEHQIQEDKSQTSHSYPSSDLTTCYCHGFLFLSIAVVPYQHHTLRQTHTRFIYFPVDRTDAAVKASLKV
jgi:hypothetical protein